MTCKCFARCEADCVCDHDWTPPAVTALREEVDRLRAELAAVRELMNCYNVGGWTDSLALMKERDEAMAELAACREDAERYRWLREHWDDVNHPVDFIICNSFVTTLDADVDAARKGEVET